MNNLFDPGAERAVLAGLFSFGSEVYIDISDFITCGSFGTHKNACIYKCIQKIVESNGAVDIPTILGSAKDLGLLEVINTKQELDFLSSLESFPIKKENVRSFALQVKKYELARNIKKISEKVNSEICGINGSESIDEILKIIEQPVAEFLQEDSINEKPQKIGEGLSDYLDFVVNNKCDQVGIPSGYNALDAAIGGGLRRKCVDLIAARPKTGKSVCADCVAVNVASKGIPVLMLDTEMSKEDHIHRILASRSEVPINQIATGKFSEDDQKSFKVNKAASEITQIPYTYVSVAGVEFDKILNIIKRWIIQDVGYDDNGRVNDCLVIFDYLKLMSSSSITNNVQEYQALGFQITALHNLAVKYDFPCLAFVQLNRDGITKESTDAVSGSDRLIWLCTSFTIFKLKSPEELAEDGPNAGNRKMVTIVARHGPGMEDGNYINMRMRGDIALLEEINTRDQNVQQRLDGGAIPGSSDPIIEDDQPVEYHDDSDDLPFEV